MNLSKTQPQDTSSESPPVPPVWLENCFGFWAPKRRDGRQMVPHTGHELGEVGVAIHDLEKFLTEPEKLVAQN